MNKVGVVEDLNDKQYEAVTHVNGSLLVLAGAGSGKTKVLTTRIYWLIKEKQVNPMQILAVTFTNKAAKEMQHRVFSLTKIEVRHMWIGTFHAIAMRLLRLHYALVGLPSAFQVIDNSEQLSMIKRTLKLLNLSDEDYVPKEIQSYINNNKDLGLRANMVKSFGVKQEIYLKIYTAYEQLCNTSGLVDFNELLLRSYELLRDNSNILQLYRGQFQHILIDEFQDTNTLQYMWIKLLKTKDNCIFAVGDDDQSIYAFRGAKVANLRSFLLDYNVVEPIRLEQNYRSTEHILTAANAVIENNSDRIGKKLWTNQKTDTLIKLYEGYTEEDEAYYVADEIASLVKKGYKYSEIAILYRSNAQSRMFEQLLYSRKIPYRVYGGLRFFDRQEIKHVLAYLRLIVNTSDDEAFLRIVNVPPRGIGPKTIEHLIEASRNNKKTLFESCDLLDSKSAKHLHAFVVLVNNLIEFSNIPEISLAAIMEQVLIQSGLKQLYSDNKKENEERLDNLNELVSAVESFIIQDNQLSLSDFLAHAVLESGEAQADGLDSAIQLMTIHAAKGLEFKVVFVAGLEDGLFPHDRSNAILENLEEERRLMYVAITRSRERLFLTRACSRLLWGKRTSSPISRFVNEIPENIIDNVSGISNIGMSYFDNVSADVNSGVARQDEVTFSKTSHVYSSHNNAEFKIGDMVNHGKFGRGKITALVSDNDKVNVDIYFVLHGKKTLNLNIATIEKID